MSRWGNFLSGIESGLDKILAEDGSESQQASTNKSAKSAVPQRTAQQRLDRKQAERLQDRLAKAVERSSSEAKRTRGEERVSLDSKNEKEVSVVIDKEQSKTNGRESTPGSVSPAEQLVAQAQEIAGDGHSSEASGGTGQLTESADDTLSKDGPRLEKSSTSAANASSGLDEKYLLERVEALQAKLDVFIKEAADKAKAGKDSTQDPSAKRIATLEEKVAALMAEGQALSQRELKHMTTIRRLHGRVNEADGNLNREKKGKTDADKTIHSLRAKIESLEASHKSSDEASKSEDLVGLLDEARKQIDAQSAHIAELVAEGENAASLDLQGQINSLRKDLEYEWRTASNLREEIENSKIERELEIGRQKAQLEAEKNKASQASTRNNLKETELVGEIKALESKLETIRSRNEEVIGGPSDGQAKQLRQIEALQRQFSVSKENWNGIEASLNARITTLEHERDESSRKEADLRRRIRELGQDVRRKEEEAEALRETSSALEDKIENEKKVSKEARAAAAKAQAEAEQAKEELKRAEEAAEAKREQSEPDMSLASPDALNLGERLLSPFAPHKTSSRAEGRDRKSNHNFSVMSPGSQTNDRPFFPASRKASAVSPYFPGPQFGHQHTGASLTRSSSRSALRDAPSVTAENDVDMFADTRSPLTAGRAFGDVLSVSASSPAAGPSVQLVERMSSAVRRLESEKAATRDELERMATERDEARKQIVAMLEEVEAKREVEGKVSQLQDEVAEMAQRYKTTLELLGEKSETVEELKADIADMKQIYRDALQKSL